ncbi:transglycosylase domain-containing protein [Deinococcus sp. SL84]|uniref:transglycosylase domain-containing protein n=1 Tax=Deinococcus sp. SL84 TaxID=2994663 RepID=UPI002275761F|nr:transglycosylase domain-containing protein [Deinococcus sp. SL84]MCY1702442.1 transglycosylase domain-containing protein [Deinococcus sp. SL84]
MRSALLRPLLGFLAAALLLALAGVGVLYVVWTRDLPSIGDVDLLALGGETRVYDRKNRLIGVLTPSLSSGALASGELLELGEISQPLRKAVVSSEDRRFNSHRGLDMVGIGRGLLKGLFLGDLEGGSSITQQLVKNTLLGDMNSERTLERKFKEAVLAYRVEKNFSKNQILAAYLNVVYWGKTQRRSIVGIDQAAHAYFGKSAAELNLAESAYLAVLIPAPNSRYQKFEEFRPLTRILLDRMVEDGTVTQAQADQAWRTPIYPAGWRIGWNADGTVRSARLENPARLEENLPAQAPQVAFHYLQAVERELVAQLGRKEAYASAKIVTGLDLDAQRAAEQAAREAELPEGATLGMAFVDPQTGEVTAMVGQQLDAGRPADWDNATQSRRQVGSSVKPFVYTLALSQGWQQSDTVLDAPLQGEYQPKNYDGRWLGYPVTLRYALDYSLNLPTVRLAQEVGVGELEGKLTELGFQVQPDLGLSLSIGTLEASPLQLASAYAAFANGGLYRPASFVRQVVDEHGKVIYQRPEVPAVRVWDERTAYLGLDMLKGVVNDLSEAQGGLATRARIEGWPVGGKTGTTNDIRDLWFAGVAPGVAGAVWVGREDNQPLPAWAYSGTVPTPIWQRAARGQLAGRKPGDFPVPQGITFATVRRVEMAFLSEKLQTPGAPAGRSSAPSPTAPAATVPAPPPRSSQPSRPPAPTSAPADPPEVPVAAPQTPMTQPPVAQPSEPQPTVPQDSAAPTPEASPDPSQIPPLPQEPAQQLPQEQLPQEQVPLPDLRGVQDEAARAWEETQRAAEQGLRDTLERGSDQAADELQRALDQAREQLQQLPQTAPQSSP